VHGVGQHIRTSLLECAMAFQESRIVEYALEGPGVKAVGAPVGTFETADGYLSLNARRDNHFEALCKLLERTEWLADERFGSEQSRLSHAEALNALVEPLIKAQPTRYWADILSSADILHAPVFDYGDLMEDEQVHEIQAITWSEIEGLGSMPAARLPGLPPPPDRPETAQPPRVGQQGRAVLSAAGLSDAEIAGLVESGAAALPD
jgi:crotonobetainyl-CoA:carnitine CoA-transferase CaiB-like acyl-CoA transferase